MICSQVAAWAALVPARSVVESSSANRAFISLPPRGFVGPSSSNLARRTGRSKASADLVGKRAQLGVKVAVAAAGERGRVHRLVHAAEVDLPRRSELGPEALRVVAQRRCLRLAVVDRLLQDLGADHAVADAVDD